MHASGWIPWASPVYWGDEEAYVVDALRSTWISGGPYVERLEEELVGRTGSSHVLTAANGTAALHLAYLGAGLQAGDEVVLPAFAFMGAANVALRMNLVPVFADIDAGTWCVSAGTMEAVIGPKTKALIPVHTYGNVCDMDPILDLARDRGLTVIEDAAESFGSRYKGRWSGTMGSIGTYSFHATKTISTGEGGAVSTDSVEVAEAMALYRSHGMKRKTFYWHELAGHNFRLTNLQAALGCAQLRHLDEIAGARTRVHRAYSQRLAGVEGIAPQEFRPDVEPVLWDFSSRLDPRAFPQGRDAVLLQMQQRGIECRPGFYAASRMAFYGAAAAPVAEATGESVISLPTYPSLSDDMIDSITTALTASRA